MIKQYSVRLDTALIARIDQAAVKDNRTRNNWIDTALAAAVGADGASCEIHPCPDDVRSCDNYGRGGCHLGRRGS